MSNNQICSLPLSRHLCGKHLWHEAISKQHAYRLHCTSKPAELPDQPLVKLLHEFCRLSCLSLHQVSRPVQASVGLLTDGTIAVEVQLAELLLQWPFLSDLSFMDAASSIFQPPTDIAEETGDPLHTAAAAAAAQVVQKGALQPWLYLNIIAVNSQFLLPVFDMVRRSFKGSSSSHNIAHPDVTHVPSIYILLHKRAESCLKVLSFPAQDLLSDFRPFAISTCMDNLNKITACSPLYWQPQTCQNFWPNNLDMQHQIPTGPAVFFCKEVVGYERHCLMP